MLRAKTLNLMTAIGSFPFFPILVFAVLSAAPFFWSTAANNYMYIGADDYLSPINIFISFHYSIYPFDHLNGAGFDQAYIVAMFPVYLFYYVMDWLGATPLFSTIFLLSLLIFVAEMAFFISLKYFLTYKLRYSRESTITICALGAILYGFSPYFIGQVLPGHGATLFVYALFPLIIRYLDALMVADKFDYTAPIALLAALAFCSPSLANIGILYVLLIAGAIYALSITLAEGLGIWRSSLRFTVFVALAFLSNAWWLSPHLYNLQNYIATSMTHGGEMVNLVAFATKDASIANILQGKPESTMYMIDILGHNYYINMFHSLIFLVITLLVICAAFSRQRQVHAMLFAALASIMFLKGIQSPFSDLFFWAYNNVPGFQVMRRPTAKFYGFFLFFFLACATFGLAIVTDKLTKPRWLLRILFGFLGIAAVYMVSIFSLTNSLKPFNIPEIYFKTRDYLMSDQVERVLILPIVSGVRPVYRHAMNSYSGMDFVNELFRFPKIAPNSVDLSINEGYLRPTNELIQLIRNNKSICETSRTLGISHIVVRDDLVQSHVEDAPRLIAAILDKHPDIIQRTAFADKSGAEFIVYKLKVECTGKLLELGGKFASFKYELRNPGEIALDIEGLRGPAELTFLNDYNPNWEVFVEHTNRPTKVGADRSRSSIAAAYNDMSAKLRLDEMRYLFKKTPFGRPHLALQYANAWTIDPTLLANEGGDINTTSNTDGYVNIRLVLYYRPQAYLLLGIIVSLAILIVLLILRTRNAKYNLGKRSSSKA